MGELEDIGKMLDEVKKVREGKSREEIIEPIKYGEEEVKELSKEEMREFLDKIRESRKQTVEGFNKKTEFGKRVVREKRGRGRGNVREMEGSRGNERIFDKQCEAVGVKRVLKNGWPDRLILYKNRWIGVEVKNQRERIKKHQRDMMDVLGSVGVKCFVYRGESKFWEDLDKYGVDKEIICKGEEK
jgi:hypothetical protein